MLPPCRTALAIGVLVILSVAAVASAARSPVTAAQRQTFTIEVSEAGFNPPLCKLSRGDTVLFLNVGATPRRVVFLDPNSHTPLYDTGDFKPNAVSLDYTGFDSPSHWVFLDTRNPAASVIVYTPTFSNSWTPNCTPDPALRPAPGSYVAPHDCATAVACLRLASLAADR